LYDAAQTLEQAGIECPRLEAEHLLATALGVERKRLYLEMGALLTDAEVSRARELLGLRATRFPLQYITARVDFLGLEFLIRQGVFIPRPETELLVAEAMALIRGIDSPRVLDVGTGSGVIAISLAASIPNASVQALDISSLAIDVARVNAAKHGVEDRVRFFHGDFCQRDLFSTFDAEFFSGRVDLIISNPPYVPTSEIPALAPEIEKYEPQEAIDGGPDGLKYVRAILERVPALVKADAWIALEIGAGQAQMTREISAAAGLSEVRIVRDMAGIERVFIARKV